MYTILNGLVFKWEEMVHFSLCVVNMNEFNSCGYDGMVDLVDNDHEIIILNQDGSIQRVVNG